MSTYYYLVCDQHRVMTDVIAGRSFPQRWWTDHPESLAVFAENHGDCQPNPRLVSEHDDCTLEYQQVPIPEAAA